MIKDFAKANNIQLEIGKNLDKGNKVLIITYHMGKGVSQFLGDTDRIMLQEFEDIVKTAGTPTLAYFEYFPKQEIIQTTGVPDYLIVS